MKKMTKKEIVPRKLNDKQFDGWIKRLKKTTKRDDCVVKLTGKIEEDAFYPPNRATNNNFKRDEKVTTLRKITASVVSAALRQGVTHEKLMHFVEMGTQLASALNEVVEKPTVTNAVKVAFNLTNMATLRFNAQPTGSYFDSWVAPFETTDFDYTVIKNLKNMPIVDSIASENEHDHQIAKVVTYQGEEIGWYYNPSLGTLSGLFVKDDRVEESKKALSELLWSSLPHKYIVVRLAKNGNERSVVFEKDDDLPNLASEQALKYAEYLKGPLGAGVHRSTMLFGPPGTGKSTMARCIVDLLNLRAIRFRIEDLSEIESSTIFEAVKIFAPDVIILDDFDRIYDGSSSLEMLQYFHNHVKLVLATVNDRTQFDQALLRPQRFDEMIKVDKMDEQVLRKILGDVLGPDNMDLYEKVQAWPVVYVQELTTRLRFQSKEEAIKSMEELERRISRAMSSSRDKFDDESDEEGEKINDSLNPFTRKDRFEDDDDGPW